jgi:hypothetical protein
MANFVGLDGMAPHHICRGKGRNRGEQASRKENVTFVDHQLKIRRRK